MSTANPYTVSHYLMDRVKELGVGHVFGVPGDYAFPLLDILTDDDELRWVGGCNENTAALAADAYARVRGFAAQVYTCGPGELGAAAGVGGSYAEQVPVLTIVGHPPLHADPAYVMSHHSLNGDFSRYEPIFSHLTAAHATLGEVDPGGQIDQVLIGMWRERRPGYIAIPKDVQTLPVAPPAGRLALPEPQSDPEQLDAFLQDLTARLHHAKRPVILADFPVGRYGLTPAVEQLVARSGIPLVATNSARSAFFDEAKPGYLGTYAVVRKGDPVIDRVADADLLLRLAAQPGETNHGLADPAWQADDVVDVQIEGATAGGRRYPRIALADVLGRLTEALPHRDVPGLRTPIPTAPPFVPAADTVVTENRWLDGVAALLREGDVLVSDQGTCSAAIGVPKPAGVRTVVQSAWGAIGYGTPALLGSLMDDPHARHVLVTGDGGFQEVAQELSTILRHGFAPIVIVLNNGHYLVENLVGGTTVRDQPYNVIGAWDYHLLPPVVAPAAAVTTLRVTTEQEWADALRTAEQDQAAGRLVLIEVLLAKDDVSDAYRVMMSPTAV